MFSAWTVGAQYLVPIGLLAWLALGRDGSRVGWAARVVLVTLWLVAVSSAGLWPVHPWIIPGAFALALLAGSIRAWRHGHRLPVWPASRRAAVTLGAYGVACAFGSALAMHALVGRRAPAAEGLDLAFPLDSGTYYVVNGGGVELLNAHLMTLSGERSRLWRGQSYAVDLIALDARGRRARGLLPADPSDYAVFGATVLAPCTGTIVMSVDGLPDLSPPRVDRAHMTGNHVMLACDGAWILLAHLRRGSVCVVAGDTVRTGQPLGQVGNSGNTFEPHLHIHAQRPGTPDTPIAGEPMVIRFDGRYLARNALVRRPR